MKLLDAILKLLGQSASQVPNLKTILEGIARQYPDAAAQLAPILAALDDVVDPKNLADLGAAIPGELLNIAKAKFDGRPHAGDSA